MPPSADPLVAYPRAREWAERFHAARGWGSPSAPPGDRALELRRSAALAETASILPGPEFLPEVRRAFMAGARVLRKAAAEATNLADFDSIDAEILALKNDIAAQKLVADARIAAAASLAVAEARHRAAVPLLDEGGLTCLEGRLGAARSAFDTATTAKDVASAKGQADRFPALADAALKHAAEKAPWTRASLAFVFQRYPDGPLRKAAFETRATVDRAAADKARAGDFQGATAALAAFPGDANAGDFAQAQGFIQQLARFEAAEEAMCRAVTSSELEDARTVYQKYPDEARTLGLRTARHADAIRKLDDLVGWCQPRAALAARLTSYDQGMKAEPVFRSTVAEMNRLQKAGDVAGAMLELGKLDAMPELQARNESLVIDRTLGDTVDKLLKQLQDPHRSELDAAWKAHRQALKDKDKTAARAQAARIREFLVLDGMSDLWGQAKVILARHPAARGYDYRKDDDKAARGRKYADARKALETALPLLHQLDAYLDRVKETADIRAALPADPPALRDDLDNALTAAELKARAGRPKQALEDIDAFLKGGGYAALAAEIADWKAKDAAVARRHARVVKLVGLPGPVRMLDDALEAARRPALDTLAYADSVMALIAHEGVLADAQEFAALRRQVLGVQAQVMKAARARPALLDPAPATQTTMDEAVAEAEKLAVAGRFKDAIRAFGLARLEMEALARKTAAHFEKEDAGFGSNAGHSLDRHGPDVKPEDLIRRLTIGRPPNARSDTEFSFTGASSRFRAPQDWLAGRAIAAEEAARRGVDLDATEIALPHAGVFGIAFIVEHGRPIDEIDVGRKRKEKFDPATGSFQEGNTYETYETMSGLTRARVNWTWEFEILKDVPVPDENDPGIITLTDVKASSLEQYEKAYELLHKVKPAKVGGRWVMMQQYPVADGRDDRLQTYTEDPKDLIP